MPRWIGAIGRFLYELVLGPPTPPPVPPPVPPQPAPDTCYGFQWQPGAGVPGVLARFQQETVGTGVYVVFVGSMLADTMDPFGRAGAVRPGPVFPANPAAAGAVATIVADVARNPPDFEGGWRAPAPGRLADMGGFLAYVALCLDLLDHTVTGHALLQRLTNGGTQPVFVSPGTRNQTAGVMDGAMDLLAQAVSGYHRGDAVPGALITTAVAARYPNIAGLPAQFDQLAADMNAAPLFTLFETVAQTPPAYLQNHFRYQGAPLSGANLLAWASPDGDAAFDTAVRGMSVAAEDADGIAVLDIFLLALTATLGEVAPPGPGSSAAISFFTQRAGDNIPSPHFRPPAVGLGHELMHAMHYRDGTSPGAEIYHFTTTLAELVFTGIGPAATNPITDNAIRAQWPPANIVVDASNTWAAPVQRLVYDAPPPGTTLTAIRAEMRCP